MSIDTYCHIVEAPDGGFVVYHSTLDMGQDGATDEGWFSTLKEAIVHAQEFELEYGLSFEFRDSLSPLEE